MVLMKSIFKFCSTFHPGIFKNRSYYRTITCTFRYLKWKETESRNEQVNIYTKIEIDSKWKIRTKKHSLQSYYRSWKKSIKITRERKKEEKKKWISISIIAALCSNTKDVRVHARAHIVSFHSRVHTLDIVPKHPKYPYFPFDGSTSAQPRQHLPEFTIPVKPARVYTPRRARFPCYAVTNLTDRPRSQPDKSARRELACQARTQKRKGTTRRIVRSLEASIRETQHPRAAAPSNERNKSGNLQDTPLSRRRRKRSPFAGADQRPDLYRIRATVSSCSACDLSAGETTLAFFRA